MFIKNIQGLRAVAANAVLLSHLIVIEEKYGRGFKILPDNVHLGSSGVDLFFVISGFIMATIVHDISWHKFLYDRGTRIFPPYWFYTTLVLIASLLAPTIVNSSFEHQPSLWRSYFLIPDKTAPLLAVGWTLIHEMYFYVCFALIIILMKKFKLSLPSWLFLWAISIIALNVSIHAVTQDIPPVIAVMTHPLTLEFIAGAVIGFLIRKNYSAFAFPAFAGGIIGLIAVFLLSDNASVLADNMDWTHVILIGAPYMFIVYGAVALEINGKAIAPRWLVGLGNASYSTYLGHILVLSAIGRLYALMPKHNLYMEILFVVVCIGSGNIAGLISQRIIERPLQTWSRKLLHDYLA